MTDLLPRLLLARRAFEDSGERVRLLLESTAPRWLLHMLYAELGFVEAEVQQFDPAAERVRVRQAMLPSLLYRDGVFHPAVHGLLDELAGRLELPDVPVMPRLFLHRPIPPGTDPAAPRGDCRNEAALIALAATRHGFEPVALDTLPWRARIARLRMARVVLAAQGFAPQTLLFAGQGARVAHIGARGTQQAEVAAVRGQDLAYFSEGVPPRGPFTVPEDRFAAFLDALCDPKAEAVRAA